MIDEYSTVKELEAEIENYEEGKRQARADGDTHCVDYYDKVLPRLKSQLREAKKREAEG